MGISRTSSESWADFINDFLSVNRFGDKGPQQTIDKDEQRLPCCKTVVGNDFGDGKGVFGRQFIGKPAIGDLKKFVPM